MAWSKRCPSTSPHVSPLTAASWAALVPLSSALSCKTYMCWSECIQRNGNILSKSWQAGPKLWVQICRESPPSCMGIEAGNRHCVFLCSPCHTGTDWQHTRTLRQQNTVACMHACMRLIGSAVASFVPSKWLVMLKCFKKARSHAALWSVPAIPLHGLMAAAVKCFWICMHVWWVLKTNCRPNSSGSKNQRLEWLSLHTSLHTSLFAHLYIHACLLACMYRIDHQYC